MGRPPLPIGTYGAIKTKQAGKVWEARARFRGADGRLTRMKRTGPTKTQAEHRLKEALAAAGDEVRAGEISGASKFSAIAEHWYAEVLLAVGAGTRSPNTSRIYRSYLDNHILPALGEIRMRELRVSMVNNLRNAKQKGGMNYDALKTMQSVISNVCGFAVRHEALASNPVRDLTRLENGKVKQVRALTKEERADLFGKLEKDEKAVRYDVPDLLRGLLATGVRIGELLACSGDDFQRIGGEPVVLAEHRIIRVKGEGLQRRRRQASTKGGGQTLQVPQWSVPMLTRRKLASGGAGPLWPDSRGGWRDPSNTLHYVRDALDLAGYEWVTSHVMRKTVASVLNEAGLPVRAIADQLGQSQTATTERHYIERRKTNAQAAAVLEGIVEPTA